MYTIEAIFFQLQNTHSVAFVCLWPVERGSCLTFCVAVLYCPSHLFVPSNIAPLFMYAIKCNSSGAAVLQQKSRKLICLLLRSAKPASAFPALSPLKQPAPLHHLQPLRAAEAVVAAAAAAAAAAQ